MARINYTARAKRFGTMMACYCRWCRMQDHYQKDIMKGNKYEVPQEKLLNKPFFGVEFGPDKGNALGHRPKDIAFQQAVYKAMIAHSRDAHPQNITNMISLGWIKK
jgi:hypothetical protein